MMHDSISASKATVCAYLSSLLLCGCYLRQSEQLRPFIIPLCFVFRNLDTLGHPIFLSCSFCQHYKAHDLPPMQLLKFLNDRPCAIFPEHLDTLSHGVLCHHGSL